MKQILLPLACLLFLVSNSGYSQVTGTAFRDYDGDGVYEAPGESLVTGIVVTGYNASGQCGTTTTSGTSSPNYSLAGCTGDVRIEFTIPNLGTCGLNPGIDYTSSGGSNYGSSVQFVDGTSSNVNFAINAPEDYFTASANPVLYVPCYVNGDISNSNVGDADAFVNFNYDATGSVTHMAHADQVGSTWGVSYSKQAKKIFTSAFLKRHVSLGPLGSGGIYMIDPTTNAVTNFMDLDALGVLTQGTGAYAGSGPTGSSLVPFTDVIGTNAQRNLGNGLDQPSYDAPALAQVGKLSLGDLDISDDGRYLFVVNLYDRKVYRIDLVDPLNPVAPTAANASTRITSWTIPAPAAGVSNGEIRPFALEYARGNLFVGLVASAENGGVKADLKGYVYQVPDFTSPAHTELFEIDLDYLKGYPLNFYGNSASQVAAANERRGWFPWSDDYDDYEKFGKNVYPSPMLSDIVFDADGSLILAFMDRTGHTGGNNNYGPNETSTRQTVIGGDLLRAYYDPAACSYTLESNGSAGPITTAGANNDQGPDGGEFYYRECYDCNVGGDDYHRETIMGSIALALGSGEVATTVIDPEGYDEGGVRWMSNTTGADTKAFTVYETGGASGIGNGTFSKANGLGDLAVSGELPPLEIGNRIWNDTDLDGAQDANEAGIDGVEIELLDGATVVATVTSANGGQWYFNNSNVTGNLQPNTAYTIRVKTTLNTGALAGLTAYTTKDAATGGEQDLGDSDANAAGIITYTTGGFGENNHTLDIGLTSAPPCNAPTPVGVAAERCGTGTVILTASGCDATYPAIWYSDAALTTQVGTGNSFTTPSITATTDYYVACVETADPTCKSSGATVTATVKPNPTITAATPVCNVAGTMFEVGYTATASSVITSDIGTVDMPNNKITGVPSGQTVTITATLNGCAATVTASQNCAIPCNAPTPTGVAAERCGEGTVTLTATGCDATYPAVWYSDAALATQVGTGNSFTTPSITATTDYYVACVETAEPTCKSAGVAVTATIKPNPTITAATPVCNAAGTQFEVGYTATALSVITADKGTLDTPNSKFTAIPSGETITITATLNGCTATATATATCAIPCPTPNCGSVTVIKN